jgi:sec-independent protein translocase protein TatC
MLMAGPLIILYGLSIVIVKFVKPAPDEEDEEDEEDEDEDENLEIQNASKKLK